MGGNLSHTIMSKDLRESGMLFESRQSKILQVTKTLSTTSDQQTVTILHQRKKSTKCKSLGTLLSKILIKLNKYIDNNTIDDILRVAKGIDLVNTQPQEIIQTQPELIDLSRKDNSNTTNATDSKSQLYFPLLQLPSDLLINLGNI